MTDSQLPAEAVTWLTSAERALAGTNQAQTEEILDGLRSHITEALSRGELIDDVLFRLGPASDIGSEETTRTEPASATTNDLNHDPRTHTTPSVKAGGRYFTGMRVLQFAAFLLALAAALTVSLLPGYVETTTNDAGDILSEATTIALYNMDPRVAASLIAALILTAAPVFVPGPQARRVQAASAVLMVILAIASTFWIVGWFLIPATIVSVTAAMRREPNKDLASSRTNLLKA